MGPALAAKVGAALLPNWTPMYQDLPGNMFASCNYIGAAPHFDGVGWCVRLEPGCTGRAGIRLAISCYRGPSACAHWSGGGATHTSLHL